MNEMPETPTDPTVKYTCDVGAASWSRGPHRRTCSSQAVCQTLFLSSHDAILILNSTADELVDLNPQACHMFGYASQEFLRLQPGHAICVEKGQWELLMDSTAQKRGKWLRGMACRQGSGRIIIRDILPTQVTIERRPCILVTVRDASDRDLSEALRFNARFARFSNGVAVGAAGAPDIEHAIRFCLQQICDYRNFVFAQARIFSREIVAARVPAETWYLGVRQGAKAVRAMFEAKRLSFPEKWYSHVLMNHRASVVEDVETHLEFATRLKLQSVFLKSALVVPIPVGKEIIGVFQYFSIDPIKRDPTFLETMSHVAGRLGHIIEHKLAQGAVKSLSARLFQAQDEERRNLARELHDTTAQNVTAALMDLGQIGSVKSLPSHARDAISECMSLMRRALQELRTLSYALHPPMLSELGLASALRIFIEGFSNRSGMQVELDLPDPCPRFDSKLEITLFRVVQEGLTNASRHSGSAIANVTLRVEAGQLRLIVQNETRSESSSGKSDVQMSKLGVGVRSMEERVESLGGHLTLEIGNKHAVLQACFPLSEAARATGA